VHGHVAVVHGHVWRTLCSVCATGTRFVQPSMQLVIFVLCVSSFSSFNVLQLTVRLTITTRKTRTRYFLPHTYEKKCVFYIIQFSMPSEDASMHVNLYLHYYKRHTMNRSPPQGQGVAPRVTCRLSTLHQDHRESKPPHKYTRPPYLPTLPKEASVLGEETNSCACSSTQLIWF
jgi:hypothetical protein